MRVSCENLDDYTVNLDAVDDDQIFDGVVRVSKIVQPENEVKDQVAMYSSCVIDVDDRSQFILELVLPCGYDYKDGGKDASGGSRMYADVRAELEGYLAKRKVKILPGVIDF